MFDESWIGSFEILYNDDYLFCLNDYIYSENGQKLYNYLPKSKWQSLEINNKIYGINGYAYSCQTGPVYIVNKNLMEKYNLTEEDLTKSIDELLPVLREIQDGEIGNKNFLCINIVMSYDYCDLYPVDSYIYGIKLDESKTSDELIYLLDDYDYINMLRKINIVTNNGIKFSMENEVMLSNNFINIYVGGMFPGTNIAKMGGYLEDNISEDSLIYIYPYGTNMRVNDYLSYTSVLNNSSYKEYACDFISRMYSDQYLSDLIQYGYGYQISDGRAYTVQDNQLINTGVIGTWAHSNGFIGTPSYDEFIDKTEKYFDIYEDAYVSKYSGFRFDRNSYETIVTNTNNVLSKINYIFNQSINNFDEYVSHLRVEYINSGGEELYSAIKEQWNLFRNN